MPVRVTRRRTSRKGSKKGSRKFRGGNGNSSNRYVNVNSGATLKHFKGRVVDSTTRKYVTDEEFEPLDHWWHEITEKIERHLKKYLKANSDRVEEVSFGGDHGTGTIDVYTKKESIPVMKFLYKGREYTMKFVN